MSNPMNLLFIKWRILECAHYKLYLKELEEEDLDMIVEKLTKAVKNAKDKIVRDELCRFLEDWNKHIVINNEESKILSRD